MSKTKGLGWDFLTKPISSHSEKPKRCLWFNYRHAWWTELSFFPLQGSQMWKQIRNEFGVALSVKAFTANLG